MLSLLLKRYRCGSVYVCCANGLWFGSHLDDSIVVVAHFNSYDQFFFAVFESFQTCGIGVGLTLGMSIRRKGRGGLWPLLAF